MTPTEIENRLGELRDKNWLRGYRRDSGLLLKSRKAKPAKQRKSFAYEV